MQMRIHKLYLIAIALLLSCSSSLISQTQQGDSLLLVSTDWLEDHLHDSLMLLLHYGMKTDFEKEHIPGARLVSIWDILVENEEGVRHELPGKEELEKVLRSWGIHNDSKIIICYQDGNAIPMAARLFYTLDYAGLGHQTAMLNGGLRAWKEEGKALSREVASFSEGTVDVVINEDVRITKQEVLSNLDRDNVLIVDARPYERYAGIEGTENSGRQGHIPGAVNIPFHETTEEDAFHLFKPVQDLKQLFPEQMQNQDSMLITYCGTGIWASPLYFTARLLGYRVRLYDGSFQEWQQDEALPLSKTH